MCPTVRGTTKKLIETGRQFGALWQQRFRRGLLRF
jgi:hypothetical protein